MEALTLGANRWITSRNKRLWSGLAAFALGFLSNSALSYLASLVGLDRIAGEVVFHLRRPRIDGLQAFERGGWSLFRLHIRIPRFADTEVPVSEHLIFFIMSPENKRLARLSTHL